MKQHHEKSNGSLSSQGTEDESWAGVGRSVSSISRTRKLREGKWLAPDHRAADTAPSADRLPSPPLCWFWLGLILFSGLSDYLLQAALISAGKVVETLKICSKWFFFLISKEKRSWPSTQLPVTQLLSTLTSEQLKARISLIWREYLKTFK